MIESPGRARHHGAGGVAGDPPVSKKNSFEFRSLRGADVRGGEDGGRRVGRPQLGGRLPPRLPSRRGQRGRLPGDGAAAIPSGP